MFQCVSSSSYRSDYTFPPGASVIFDCIDRREVHCEPENLVD